MRPSTSSDPRLTVAPAIIATLCGALVLSGRVVDGTAHNVVRGVLLVLLLGVVAWCASVFRPAGTDRQQRVDRPANSDNPNSQGGQ